MSTCFAIGNAFHTSYPITVVRIKVPFALDVTLQLKEIGPGKRVLIPVMGGDLDRRGPVRQAHVHCVLEQLWHVVILVLQVDDKGSCARQWRLA